MRYEIVWFGCPEFTCRSMNVRAGRRPTGGAGVSYMVAANRLESYLARCGVARGTIEAAHSPRIVAL